MSSRPVGFSPDGSHIVGWKIQDTLLGALQGERGLGLGREGEPPGRGHGGQSRGSAVEMIMTGVPM